MTPDRKTQIKVIITSLTAMEAELEELENAEYADGHMNAASGIEDARSMLKGGIETLSAGIR